MRDLIGGLRQLQEMADFGSVEWQNEMIARIKRKLEKNEPLNGSDRAFIEVQIEHNKRLADELKSLGYDKGQFNVN